MATSFHHLPDEILLELCVFLDVPSVIALAHVSRRLLAAIDCPFLWRKMERAVKYLKVGLQSLPFNASAWPARTRLMVAHIRRRLHQIVSYEPHQDIVRACAAGWRSCAQALLSVAPAIDAETAADGLNAACRGGHAHVVAWWLGLFAPLLQPYDISGALGMAVEGGHVRIVQELCRLPAFISVIDWAIADDGGSALHVCVGCNYPGCLSLLLEAGANPNVLNAREATPLHEAMFDFNMALVGPLLAHGANPLLRDAFDNTPRMLVTPDTLWQQVMLDAEQTWRDKHDTSAAAESRRRAEDARRRRPRSSVPLHMREGLRRLQEHSVTDTNEVGVDAECGDHDDDESSLANDDDAQDELTLVDGPEELFARLDAASALAEETRAVSTDEFMRAEDFGLLVPQATRPTIEDHEAENVYLQVEAHMNNRRKRRREPSARETANAAAVLHVDRLASPPEPGIDVDDTDRGRFKLQRRFAREWRERKPQGTEELRKLFL